MAFLYDRTGNIITYHDLQDKGAWCDYGTTKEDAFVEKFGQHFGVLINPEKKINKYAPDLFDWRDMRRADLKTQNTPFFTATRYSLDPQYAITFNVKDFERYNKMYPELDLYFWIDWCVVRYGGDDWSVQVEPMERVYFIPFHQLCDIIKTAPIHYYQQRQDDTKGNAKNSYVLTVTHNLFTQIF